MFYFVVFLFYLRLSLRFLAEVGKKHKTVKSSMFVPKSMFYFVVFLFYLRLSLRFLAEVGKKTYDS